MELQSLKTTELAQIHMQYQLVISLRTKKALSIFASVKEFLMKRAQELNSMESLLSPQQMTKYPFKDFLLLRNQFYQEIVSLSIGQLALLQHQQQLVPAI